MPVFETRDPVAIRISSPAGLVVVDAWDDPRVDVDVTPLGGDEGSRQAADETRVEATDRSGRHQIVIEVPKREGRFGFLGRSPELRITIRCPEGTDVELSTHSADFEARGTLGEVEVRSASGDASLDDARALGFSTASGDLSAGRVHGPLRSKGASGDVDVRFVAGRAQVGTVSGDVRLGRTDGVVNVKAVSGDVDLESIGADVRVSAVSGDVSIAARPGLALWIDAQSVSGTMQSDLDVGHPPEVGSDDPQVELKVQTVSGDVRISRATMPVL
jgi:DUF4097 and DUF4098 domain-containing protein YvlB